MSATGKTPIQLYRTGTAAAVPVAGNLMFGEMALNYLDEKLYFKNAAGVVTLLAASGAAPQTFTGLKTFTGSASNLALALQNAAETCTVSATAATGTINFDVTTQSVLYYTTNASGNWAMNFRGSSGASLNTVLAVGQSVTVVFMVTQGSTAYYNNAIQVDGASVTPKYQGGAPFAFGNASGIDVYSYTIIKTASATFTVLVSQTRFA